MDEPNAVHEPMVYENTALFSFARDSRSVTPSVRYCQPAPANRIRRVEVSHDAQSISFAVLCEQPLDEKRTAEIQVLLGAGEPHLSGWESYDWVIRYMAEEHMFCAECLSVNENKAIVKDIVVYIDDKQLSITLPRMLLTNSDKQKFYFKVAMGIEEPKCAQSYYTSGSSVPPGRLSYVYNL